MPDSGNSAAPGGTARRFLTFLMDEKLYALPAEEVSEVIRIPPVARLPQGPKSLLGLANLRGSVLPVASLRGLLGREERDVSSSSRAILIDGAAPVALAVDAVQGLVTVQPERVETRQAELAADPGERLTGAFPAAPDGQVAKILDIRGLLSAAFAPRARSDRGTRGPTPADAVSETREEDDRQALLAFEVAGQEYALPLACVQEIVPAPAAMARVPRSEALVLGVTSYRQNLMPLLSLRGLLGFPPSVAPNGREKVVVTVVGGALVGLVADRVRTILQADPGLVEPTPSVLAARTGGEARIKAIYRGEEGRRLVSILAPEQLFREDVMQRLGAGREAAFPEVDGEAAPRDERQFLVFGLADEEFALPIEAVDEVARVPAQITRVPRTPQFLEGVVNLRGEVLPVVDQRRRFDMPPGEAGARRRLVVVRTERHRAGLIVDSVCEVLRTDRHAIEPAPDLAGEPTRLVEGVINLSDAGRMVLLLDPTELLSRAERGLLDAFEAETAQAAL
jgi:purine-binding chemotaxis protein CheW